MNIYSNRNSIPSQQYGGSPIIGQPPPGQMPMNDGDKNTYNCNCDFVNVTDPGQVKEFIVRPGQKIYFLDNNRPLMYTKEANNFGTTDTRAYKVTEVDFEELVRQMNEPQNNCITRDELRMLFDRLNANDDAISSLAQKIDEMSAPKNNKPNDRRNKHEPTVKQK